MTAQALAVVVSMMATFGQANDTQQTSEVGCIAATIWQGSRTASFERKLEMAADTIRQGDCFLNQSIKPDEWSGIAGIEFAHRRDAEAWDDAVLAALSVISTGVTPADLPEVAKASRAEMIARGNVIDFWMSTPIAGIDIEPPIDLLRHAARLGED